MTLPELSQKWRLVVYSLVIVLMTFGVWSYFTLPAQEDPAITIREAVVTVSHPGLSAERMELLVTKQLEKEVRTIPEIAEIRTTTSVGTTILHAKLHPYINETDQIWDKLRDKVAEAQSSFPDGTKSPKINSDLGDVAVLTAALMSEGGSVAMKNNLAAHIRDKLYAIDGVKRVDLHGLQQEQIFIEAENARLAELGIAKESLIAAVKGRNIIQQGGLVDTGSVSFVVEPSGQFQSLEDLSRLLLPLPDGGTIALQDIAKVTRGINDPLVRKVYVNGKEAIVMAVAMLDGYRVLEFAPRVIKELDALEQTLPLGFHIEIVTNQAEQVADAVYGVSINVLQTLAIVLVVVILFLGMRTGLIVGAIVPAVMLVTLAIMGAAGIPLERMSLATLVIALGLLVDNGIVIAEDYKRRLLAGQGRDEALRGVGKELTFPLLSSTLTTIIVFLPLMFAKHEAGEYTRSISLVILISLTASWLLAMCLTPILSRAFIKVSLDASKTQKQQGGLFAHAETLYGSWLGWILRHRGLFLLATLACLVIAGASMRFVPEKFFPNSDRRQLLTYVDLPASFSASAVDQALAPLLARLQNDQLPWLGSYAAYVGYGGPRFVLSLTPIDPAPNKAFMVLNVNDGFEMDRSIEDMRALFREYMPMAQARVNRMFLGPSDPGVLQAQVKGPDANIVYQAGMQLKSIMSAPDGVIDDWQDWQDRVTRVQVEVDDVRASRTGITNSSIAQALQAHFSGLPISQFREGDDILPIVVRAAGAERFDVQRIRSVFVTPQSLADGVALEQVANVHLKSGFSTIQRENLARTLTVEVRHPSLSPEDLSPQLQPQLDKLSASLPVGHWVEWDGIITDSAAGKRALAANVPVAVASILLLLLIQFNSVKKTATVLSTIPLLIIGAAAGLLMMKAEFGFMVILGLFSLAGIIINNGIVLIDRIDIEIGETPDQPIDAVIRASQMRLRPIVMTTVTTILGLLPLILAKDPLFYGMSSVIAFGLLVGTVLTLGVVPAIYAALFRLPR